MTADLFNFVSWAEYLEIDAVNFSSLKNMAQGADYYKWRLANPLVPTTDMKKGTAIHTMVLEPDQFSARYAVWEGARRGEAYAEMLAIETASGREVITSSEYDCIKGAASAVFADADAQELLAGALTEQTIQWEMHGFKCKARLDAIKDAMLTDLKSTVDPLAWKFGRKTGDMFYHAQFAFYRDGYKIATGKDLPFSCVAVASKPYHFVGVYDINEETLTEGQALYTNWLNELRACLDTDAWHKKQKRQELRLPAYMMESSMDTVDFSGLE